MLLKKEKEKSLNISLISVNLIIDWKEIYFCDWKHPKNYMDESKID